MDDNFFMKIALAEAAKAAKKNEVPVGAVLIDQNGHIISAAHNLIITLSDPTAHAEILVLRKAALITKNYRLKNTIIYTTLEPCIMCMGAIIHARIEKVVFGAYDSKWGGCGSLYDFSTDKKLNHNIKVTSNIMEEQCRTIIQNFFKIKRKMLQLSVR